jgi:ketosteroid isomerase-like protein
MGELAAEIEVLREAYAALNRNDIPAMVEAFDEQVEWTEFAGLPGGGSYHGYEAVKAHFMQAHERWAEGTCEPERFIVAGDRIVVFVRVHVRLKDETEWREGDLADVYTFRNGKVIAGRVFADRQQALEWAGVKAPNAI